MNFPSKIIGGLPKPIILLLLIVSIIAVCLVDYLFEPRVSLILFYLF